MRGEEEREGDTNKGRTQQQEREGEESGGEREVQYIYTVDGREDTTTDDEEEEEERPHGRLTLPHDRDLADVPRGQVLVESGGFSKH